MRAVQYVLLLLTAYFSGTVFFGEIIVRLVKHEDVQNYGDGNPGAFNTGLACGLGCGILCALLDIAKAAAPVWLGVNLLQVKGWELLPLCLAPLMGHMFPVQRKWRGGKGISAAFGSLIGLIPGTWLALVWAVCILAALAVIHNRDRAMILSVVLFLAAAFFYTADWALRAVSVCVPGSVACSFLKDQLRPPEQSAEKAKN